MHRLITACLALAALPAFADLTMVSTAVSAGTSREVTLSVRGSKAFFELKQEGTEPRTMVRDGDAKKMYIVNHQRKQLVVVTEQDSEQLKAQQEQLQAQLKAQLSKLPPEQRARLEASMLPQATPPKAAAWTYEKKKSPARKVAGFSCQDYVVKRDGQVNGEACYAQWKDAGMTAAEFKATLERAMPRMAGEPSTWDMEGQESAPGFPVHRVFVDEQGKVKTETTLKSLTKTAVAAEKFELPKDYELKEMGAMMPGGRPGRPMPGMMPGAMPTPAPAPAKP